MSPAISTKDMETKVKTYSRRHVFFFLFFFWGWGGGVRIYQVLGKHFGEISLINPGEESSNRHFSFPRHEGIGMLEQGGCSY